MSLADNIERSVGQMNITTTPQTDKRILNDAFAALEKSARKHPLSVRPVARRRIIGIRVAEMAAAAVIIVGFVLFFNLPDKDIKLSDIYQAVANVENICITTFEPTSNEPMQIEWVSRTLNIDMFRIGEQFILLDVPNKLKMTKNASSEFARTQALSGKILTRVNQAAGQRFGLFPFSRISDISGAQWSRVEDPQTQAVMPGTKVYDLKWSETNTASGSINLRKWRVYLDKKTKLPRRTEWYPKREPEDEFEFESFDIVTYPDESQIRTFVRDTFGAAALQQHEPEPIGTPFN
jgi:hypothetical protein